MESNIFCIGSQVEGESFFGRHEYIEELRNQFIASSYRAKISKSIIGLTRLGKSSLVYNTFENQGLIEKHIIYINESLGEYSYTEMWQQIMIEIRKQLKKMDMLDGEIIEHLSKFENDDIKWIILNNAVKDVFEYLNEQKIKTILVLDEFDKASSIFENETKKFELLRTVFSSPKYAVFPITISRRSLHTIEGTTYQSSTFHGVLDPIYLTGFNSADIEEYFSKYELYGIFLSEKQKDEIVYYTGYSPYLLSVFGHKIVEKCKLDKCFEKEIDISSVFYNDCKLINDYYRDVVKHLERDGDLKRLIPFVVGPNIGVTKNDKDELINLGYLRIEDNEIIAISKYFGYFLSCDQLTYNIWDLLIETEKKMKQLIEKEMENLISEYKVYGKSLKEIEKNILLSTERVTDKDIKRYDSFISNNQKQFNKSSTYFDVMSFNDAVKIIIQSWMSFSKYFLNDKLSDWEYKLQACSVARNPIAHGHEDYLTKNQKIQIDSYCKEIAESVAKSNCFKHYYLTESELVKKASSYKKTDQFDVADDENDFVTGTIIGMEKVFICKGTTNNGGKRGVLKDTEDKANISSRNVEGKIISNEEEVRVKVMKWDENGKTFNVIPID